MRFAMTRLRLDATEGTPSVRRVALNGTAIDYRLVRTRRRSIGMQIHLDGLTVRAPRWIAIREIEAALRERADWILRRLEEWRGRRREAMPREWKTGGAILYRGNELSLAVFPSRQREVRADLFDLTVQHPAAWEEPVVASFVGEWLRQEAMRLLAPRVADFASELSRAAPPVKLSNARSEWGSCNSRGEIRLNWRLVQLPALLADYVVAHEVAHLIELNHSSRFWAVVESLLPGHAEHRRALDDWTALLAA